MDCSKETGVVNQRTVGVDVRITHVTHPRNMPYLQYQERSNGIYLIALIHFVRVVDMCYLVKLNVTYT